MLSNFFLPSSKGQTLIEVLAAFGIAVSLVSAITVTVIFALSTTRSGKNKNLATQYAQEGMEIVRRTQEAGQLQDDVGECLKIGGTILTSKGGQSQCPVGESPFLREVKIENTTLCGGAKQIKVTVKWSDNTCSNLTANDQFCNKTEISSCLPQTNNAIAIPGSSVVSPTPTKVPFPVPILTIRSDPPGFIWNSIPDAKSYRIFMCHVRDSTIPCTPSPIDVVTSETYNFFIDNQCNFRRYQVAAVFQSGESGRSGVVGWNTGGCVIENPDA